MFAKSGAVLQFARSDFCRLDLEKKKQCINPRGAQVANELKLICNERYRDIDLIVNACLGTVSECFIRNTIVSFRGPDDVTLS